MKIKVVDTYLKKCQVKICDSINESSVIVKEYLDDKTYENATDKESRDIANLNPLNVKITDLHSGNIKKNRTTGEFVIMDWSTPTPTKG